MLRDVLFLIGLGTLAFCLMLGWFASVASATSTPIPRIAVYIAGAFCALVTLFLIFISVFHLGHRLFGWMVLVH